MKTLRHAGRRRFTRTLTLSAAAASLAALCGHPTDAAAGPLKERAMVAPAPLAVTASVVNERWIQIYLPEKAYDNGAVGTASNYTIKSVDDPAFSGAGLKADVAQHRHFPEAAPYAEDQNFGDPGKITVVYRVYLKLPKAMTEGKTYTVTPAGGVNIGGPYTFTFSAKAPNEAIHVNQVAYLAEGLKIAYLSAWTGQGTVDFGSSTTFEIIDEATNTSAFSGNINMDVTAANEPWSKSNVYSMDFSSLIKPGKYHVYVPGVGSSFSFRIGEDAYNQIGYTLIRGLTMQRDGDHGLNDPAVTHWSRPPAHIDDAVVESTGQQVDLEGGHMDAGDRGKYPHNTADVSGSLLSAIRLFPGQVEALGETLQIPESNNGIPDLIDEAVHELDFLYKVVANTPKDGTVPFYLRPAGGGFEQGTGPEGKKKRVLFDETQGPNRSETLYAAGVLAMAYNTPLLQQYVPQKCTGYLTAAKRAFKGFMDHTGSASYFKEKGWYDPWKGGPTPWADEMLVAATNLLEATGDAQYLPPLKAAMPADLKAVKHWGWVLTGPWLSAFVSMATAKSPAVTQGIPGIVAKAEAAIADWGNATFSKDGKPYAAPFGMPLPGAVYSAVGWYFSGDQTAFPAMVAYGITKDPKYRDVILKTWNYLLGSNPLSRTFISGLGDPQRSPRWMVHEIGQFQWQQYKANNANGWSEIPPGIPSADIQNGDWDGYMDTAYNTPRKTQRFPALADYPALYRYHDSWTVKNEFTIDRLARGAVSVIPFITGASAPPGSPSSGEGAGGGGPGTREGGGGHSGDETSSGSGSPTGGDDGTGSGAGNGPDDGTGSPGGAQEQPSGPGATTEAGSCTLSGAGSSGASSLGWGMMAAALLSVARRARRTHS